MGWLVSLPSAGGGRSHWQQLAGWPPQEGQVLLVGGRGFGDVPHDPELRRPGAPVAFVATHPSVPADIRYCLRERQV